MEVLEEGGNKECAPFWSLAPGPRRTLRCIRQMPGEYYPLFPVVVLGFRPGEP